MVWRRNLSSSELCRYSENLADLRGKQYDRNTAGLVSFYLVPSAARAALQELRESFAERL